MEQERKLAKELLNAVWNQDVKRVDELLTFGADASWVFNGYPIIHHAVYLRDKKLVNVLIEHGAQQISGALSFALNRGIGEMIGILTYHGGVPGNEDDDAVFGYYPSRYAPLNYQQFMRQ